MTSENKSLAYRDKMTSLLSKRNDEIACLNESVQELKTELTLKTQSNNKLRIRMEDFLNESINMESSLQEENAQLTTSINCLKSENKSLSQLITDLKDEFAHLKENVNSDKLAKEVKTLLQENSRRLSTLVFNLKADNNNLKKASFDLKYGEFFDQLTNNYKVASKKMDTVTIKSSKLDKIAKSSETEAQSQVSLKKIISSVEINKSSHFTHTITKVTPPLATLNCDRNNKSIYEEIRVAVQSTDTLASSDYDHKVLILGDSQARNMGVILKSLLNTSAIQVLNIFKPNGLLEDVIMDVKRLTRDFRRHDFVVVIEGSYNAINGRKPDIKLVVNSLRELKRRLNLVVMSTPFVRNFNIFKSLQ
ncbi:hypothetical protein FQR65_LT02010 [Abscondita terminalis]|nr:hypothetical protein FQR65_LT02010 [Abscondita terminalis]